MRKRTPIVWMDVFTKETQALILMNIVSKLQKKVQLLMKNVRLSKMRTDLRLLQNKQVQCS